MSIIKRKNKERLRSTEFQREKFKIDYDEAKERREVSRAEAAKERALQEKKRRERRFFFRYRFLPAVAICIVLASVFAASMLNVFRLEKEHSEVQAQNQALHDEKLRLEEDLANVESAEYVEQEARTVLRMVRPGEILYILPERDPDAPLVVMPSAQDSETGGQEEQPVETAAPAEAEE